MDFKFNFQLNEETPNTENVRNEAQDEDKVKVNPYQEITIEKIQEEWNCDFLFEVDRVNVTAENADLLVVLPLSQSVDGNSEEKPNPESDKIPNFDNKQYDLVPNVYEGGFKIWECTLDLISYIRESNIDFNQKKILDLGCGVGLLGVYALTQCGAHQVDFQDYNQEVLLRCTGPTVIVNHVRHAQKSEPLDIASESPSKKMKFPSNAKSQENSESNKNETDFTSKLNLEDGTYVDDILKGDLRNENLNKRICFRAGDWKHVQKVVEQRNIKYDIILSSETIYNPSAYEKLHSFVSHTLSSEGTAYLAAKSHYFGVGGGVDSWREYVRSLGVFDIVVTKKYEDNLRRKILKMNFKP